MRVHPESKIRKLKELRKVGYSIIELTKELSMPKTTVWHHVQGVKIPPEYMKILRAKQGGSKNKFNLEWEKAKTHAQSCIYSLNKLEKIVLATALYWAEGSKGDFSLSNSDPLLIKTFIHCLKELGVEKDRISINIRIYEDLDPVKVCKFWSKATGVPKTQIKYVNVLYGKKKGKLPYGLCRVRVTKGGYFLKLIYSIRDNISAAISQ